MKTVTLFFFIRWPMPPDNLLGHAPRAGDDGGQVKGNPGGCQAEILGAVHQVENLGRPQQRLGGNAAPVQADAPKMFAFDNRDLQAQLACPDGGHIAPRPGTDHDHVEALIRHSFLPQKK
jgi:hypothetical protein